MLIEQIKRFLTKYNAYNSLLIEKMIKSLDIAVLFLLTAMNKCNVTFYNQLQTMQYLDHTNKDSWSNIKTKITRDLVFALK